MDGNRWIVVTGVTRGLGRELAIRFAERGHRVCGCGRDEGALASLQKQLGDAHRFDRVDVGSDPDVAAWAARVDSGWRAPSLLINNAALINHPSDLWRVPVDEFDAVIDVNIKGVANVIRHFVPGMVASGEGVIVNLSSGWGRSTSPGMAPYCATKWAIEGMTQALAAELPGGIAAVALNPGIIDTDMLRIAFGSGAASYEGAEEWSRRAAERMLSFSAADNGASASI